MGLGTKEAYQKRAVAETEEMRAKVQDELEHNVAGARLQEQRAGEERTHGGFVNHSKCCRWTPSDFERVLVDINQWLWSTAVVKGSGEGTAGS